MRIKVFLLSSELHNELIINNETKSFLHNIKKELELTVETVEFVFNSEDDHCDLEVILIQSGGSENYFLQQIARFNEPYYLLTYGSNNSLAASMEILSYLKDRQKEAEILHGSVKYLARRIIDLNGQSKHLKKVNKSIRLGVIGAPSDWLIASKVDYLDALRFYNIDLIDISMTELLNQYEKINSLELPRDQRFDYIPNEVLKAQKMTKALSEIQRKYQLFGLTIRCFDLLNQAFTTGCLGLATLNSEGIIGTCEGDIPTLITMYVLKALTGKSSFQVNASQINVETKEIIFAHCTIPFDMLKDYQLKSHYESNSGVAIKGELFETTITIFKIGRNLKDYYVSTGKIISNLNKDNLCRTQVLVKIDGDIEYFLNHPLGNHHVIVYGNHLHEIEVYMKGIHEIC